MVVDGVRSPLDQLYVTKPGTALSTIDWPVHNIKGPPPIILFAIVHPPSTTVTN
jgi:hypothetical protein